MTHRAHGTSPPDIVQRLAGHGIEGMCGGTKLLLNEVMLPERAAVLRAAPYGWSERWRGHANLFKVKTVRTRVGPLHRPRRHAAAQRSV